ncbi:hypothetical protein QBC38DRAFT_548042 [Podospora fimiseda]|uniref:Uncharacterized protein n=1 Tax=Podospora fimiseda TaxID=252190 RepID=A0AAN7BIK3_9PEZI|nr:hypothetical protein QBC38DRAFT_548042 [Podospora fimiseda]
MSWKCCNCQISNPDGHYCAGQVPGHGQISYLIACGHVRCLSCTEGSHETHNHSPSSFPSSEYYQNETTSHNYHHPSHHHPHYQTSHHHHDNNNPQSNHPSPLATYLSSHRLSPTVMTIGEYDTLTNPPKYLAPLGYMEDYLHPTGIQDMKLDLVGTKSEEEYERLDKISVAEFEKRIKKEKVERKKKIVSISVKREKDHGKERDVKGKGKEVVGGGGGGREKKRRRCNGGHYQPTVEDVPEEEEW